MQSRTPERPTTTRRSVLRQRAASTGRPKAQHNPVVLFSSLCAPPSPADMRSQQPAHPSLGLFLWLLIVMLPFGHSVKPLSAAKCRSFLKSTSNTITHVKSQCSSLARSSSAADVMTCTHFAQSMTHSHETLNALGSAVRGNRSACGSSFKTSFARILGAVQSTMAHCELRSNAACPASTAVSNTSNPLVNLDSLPKDVYNPYLCWLDQSNHCFISRKAANKGGYSCNQKHVFGNCVCGHDTRACATFCTAIRAMVELSWFGAPNYNPQLVGNYDTFTFYCNQIPECKWKTTCTTPMCVSNACRSAGLSC